MVNVWMWLFPIIVPSDGCSASMLIPFGYVRILEKENARNERSFPANDIIRDAVFRIEKKTFSKRISISMMSFRICSTNDWAWIYASKIYLSLKTVQYSVKQFDLQSSSFLITAFNIVNDFGHA